MNALVRKVTIKYGAVVGQDMGWLRWLDPAMIFTAHPFTDNQWKLTAMGYGLCPGVSETYGSGALYVEAADLIDVPNTHALAEERSDDSQQRVVGHSESKGA